MSQNRFLCLKNTSGHDNPHMASKINALQQKSPPRAKLFGAGVIVAWAFLFRRILWLDQRIRIFGGAVVCDDDSKWAQWARAQMNGLQ